VSIIYDDRARLEDRIYRLMSSAAHSQRPRSRMRRVVGNIRYEVRVDRVIRR
jgi:3-phenylpropionate/cinnamic acid dioxygenase small subunit